MEKELFSNQLMKIKKFFIEIQIKLPASFHLYRSQGRM